MQQANSDTGKLAFFQMIYLFCLAEISLFKRASPIQCSIEAFSILRKKIAICFVQFKVFIFLIECLFRQNSTHGLTFKKKHRIIVIYYYTFIMPVAVIILLSINSIELVY